jgi:hypothetical protein
MANKARGPGEENLCEPFKELTMPEARGANDEGQARPDALDPKTLRIIGDFREKLGLPRGPESATTPSRLRWTWPWSAATWTGPSRTSGRGRC